MDLVGLSRYISLLLRHRPEAAGITLDEHGWADVEELLEGIGRTRYIDMAILEEIVRTDDKQRYSFNENNQGHSVPVDVELPQTEPPGFLYHGTGENYVVSISEKGLLHRGRLYVHLSGDMATALKVGARHGKPVIYRVDSGRMSADGYVFFRSVNGVWLTKHVPAGYLTIVS